MLQRELQSHQWKTFMRHPMLERNLGVRIFMFIIFGMLGLQLLSAGFLLDKILLEAGDYNYAIYTFNSIVFYLFLFDFLIKSMMKQSNSMQIAPYLTLPIKRNKLFNFLLVKEFSNVWNLYFLFLIVPFAFKAITPYFGIITSLLYILFFYLSCVANSLFVNIISNIQKKSGLLYFLPFIMLAIIVGISFIPNIPLASYSEKIGEWILANNPLVWITLLALIAGLWFINQRYMRAELYREMQGKKAGNATIFSRLSFLDRLGEKGEFINMDIKLMSRSKRLSQQLYMLIFFIVFYAGMLYSAHSPIQAIYFQRIFFTIFVVGFLGMIMGQYLFTSESSCFDGLMARKHSVLNMLKGKYIFYSSYSVILTLLLMIPVFQGKLSLFFVVSVFFYTVGVLYFLMFQNAVYNKSYFDPFDRGMMNWKGTSGNMLVVTLLGMFLPVVLVSIISSVFSPEIANYFMFISGVIFTLTSKYWLEWTYKRFLKRKHKNMEGFRSNV